MNKYILADMVTERLKREIGMVAKALPEELKTLETVLPSGRVRFDSAFYQADKLKKIAIIKSQRGESGAGGGVVIVFDDEYDIGYIGTDIIFDLFEKGKIFVEFEFFLLVKDEESTRKYVDPFRKWYEAICKLPSEPLTGWAEPGEFLEANLPPTRYQGLIPDDYTDEVVKFAEQYYDILLDIYRKAEPVKDVQRRRKMDAARSEWNKRILDDEPSGLSLIEAFGRQTAELFFQYFVNL